MSFLSPSFIPCSAFLVPPSTDSPPNPPSTLQVFENELFSQHKIMCPPNLSGTVVRVWDQGLDGKEEHGLDDNLLTIQDEVTGEKTDLTMTHFW